jgi:hypothetical protein
MPQGLRAVLGHHRTDLAGGVEDDGGAVPGQQGRDGDGGGLEPAGAGEDEGVGGIAQAGIDQQGCPAARAPGAAVARIKRRLAVAFWSTR